MVPPVVSLTCTFRALLINLKFFRNEIPNFKCQISRHWYKSATLRRSPLDNESKNNKPIARLKRIKPMNAKRLIYFFVIIILFASCSATKGLTDNQTLYSGSKIKIESTTQHL